MLDWSETNSTPMYSNQSANPTAVHQSKNQHQTIPKTRQQKINTNTKNAQSTTNTNQQSLVQQINPRLPKHIIRMYRRQEENQTMVETLSWKLRRWCEGAKKVRQRSASKIVPLTVRWRRSSVARLERESLALGSSSSHYIDVIKDHQSCRKVSEVTEELARWLEATIMVFEGGDDSDGWLSEG